MPLTYSRLVSTPVLTTIHGFSSAQIMPIYQKYRDGYFVSVSDSDRAAGLNYLATVYNGIDLSLYPLQEHGGDDLVFLGRIHPDKGVHLAIEVARLSGMRLVIAGIIQDENYFQEQVKPHLDAQHRLHRTGECRGKERAVRASSSSTALEHDSGTVRTCSGRSQRRWCARDRNGPRLLSRGDQGQSDRFSGEQCHRSGSGGRTSF